MSIVFMLITAIRVIHTDMKKLTRKQKAFADKLLEEPRMSATKAIQQTYNPTTYRAARAMASENLANPNIMAYLANHAEHAEKTLVEIMNYSSDMGQTFSKEGASYAAVAVSAAKDVLDRVHGKATQKIETKSTTVNLNLSLTDIT